MPAATIGDNSEKAAKQRRVICAVGGCARPIFAKGFCNPHYKRMLRHGDPLAGNTEQGAPMAWLELAIVSETDDCLEFPFARAVNYGSIRIDGKAVGAHRYVCQRVHGDAPEQGMEAAHRCGNSACCNPKHLRWATPASNCADKKIHGTQPIGERVGGSKFKDADIIEMRRLRKSGLTFQEIADRFSHDIGATRRIIIGETWAHLPL